MESKLKQTKVCVHCPYMLNYLMSQILILFTYFVRVLSYDTERLQFVADLSTPAQDPGALYALSSRFHRFFLKNVNTQDINTRILRIGGASSPIPQHLQHGNVFGSPTYAIGGANLFPTAPPSPLLYKTEITHAPFSPRPLTEIKSSFVDNFFNSIRQPYQYEPVGVINKSVKNPFTALNTGETPEVFLKPRPAYTSFQKTSQSYGSLQQPILSGPTYGLLDNPNFLSKVNPGFSDFNSIRHTKSIAFNSTALH